MCDFSSFVDHAAQHHVWQSGSGYHITFQFLSWQAGPGVEVLAKVQARPCAAAKACVQGIYEQQQKEGAGAYEAASEMFFVSSSGT